MTDTIALTGIRAFGRHGARVGGAGCIVEIEQTEGGFSGIVFHGLMRQCDLLVIFSTVTADCWVVNLVVVVVVVVVVEVV